MTENLYIVLISLIFLEVSYLLYLQTKTSSYSRHRDSIFVDTSVLIDGRILELAKTGFIPGDLQIPRSVVGELQLLADNGDSDKRTKARFGLDVIKGLQELAPDMVAIYPDGPQAPEGVDNRLLKLAKQNGAKLMTIDYNLNKVASVEGLVVLNINDLAKQLRMNYLPGDMLSLHLTQPGSDSHQAVGHLTDGTMVVVEHAKSLIGQSVEVEIIRSLQTAAGKMMFAKLVKSQPAKPKQPAKGRKAVQPKPKSDQPKAESKPNSQSTTQPRRTSKRRATSKQHEASLVRLANQD